MSSFTLRRVGFFSLPLALALALVTVPVAAQEKGAAKPAAKSEKKLTGRLPAYYGSVVTKEQREKIYAVQAKYTDQIEKLLSQVESLEKVQKEEIEAVLTPEQRDQVAKLTSDAKSKRSKKTESTTEEVDPAK